MATDSFKKLEEVISEIKTAPDSQREDLKKKFFAAAIDVFNNDIAGDIETADGRIIHTPRLEFVTEI